jgi:alpha-methylacyl-CoA racemase
MSAKPLLAGIKILDLTRLLPGPVSTMLLADMGAEVLKIEDTLGSDAARYAQPMLKKNSQVFCHINRNKKSLTLNLQEKKAQDIFLKLVKTFDVVIEGFRPGVMAKFGLDYETVKKANPKIIFCSLTGYGQTGPYKNHPGHDLNYLGYSGVLDQTGRKDEPPSLSNFQMADLAGGSMMAVTGILAAYIHAQKTGEGCHLDVAMMDGALALSPISVGSYILSKQKNKKISRGDDFLNGGSPCYQVYETKDKRFMALAALEKKFWDNFIKIINREDLAKHHGVLGKKGEALRKELTKVFKKKTQKQWIKIFENSETCCSPVLNFGEVLQNEQVKARGLIKNQKHAVEGDVLQVLMPLQINGQIYDKTSDSPQVGEHTSEVLRSLGYSQEEISALKKSNLV